MRRLALLAVPALLLAACGSDDEPTNSPRSVEAHTDDATTGYVDWGYAEVDTPDGVVECVIATYDRGGGPSCNWEKFNQEHDYDE